MNKEKLKKITNEISSYDWSIEQPIVYSSFYVPAFVFA